MTWPDRPSLPVSSTDAPLGPLLDWARDVLADAGYRVTPGAPDVRRRSWSTVARLTTDRGPVWVKAGARAFGVEAGLLALLARHAPDHVVVPVATDPARNWSITTDGGPTLADAGPVSDDARATLLAGYADLQRRLAVRPDELRSVGLPDLTPARLIDWHRAVLARLDIEPTVAALLSADERKELAALVPTTAALAAELAADGLPATVEHLDLHDGNVLVGPDGRLRLFDWGDAVLAHPFHSLGRPLAREPGEVRERYLRRWADGGPVPSTWRRSVDVAVVTGLLTTAASRLRMPLAEREAWAQGFTDLLRDYVRRAPAARDAGPASA